MAVHTKIDSEEEIPDLCKRLFLPRDNFLSMIWVAAVTLLGTAGGCMAWILTTNDAITTIKQEQVHQDSEIRAIQDNIDKKLDILIKRL